MMRIFWTIAGVCFALYLFHGCFFYKSMTHLSKDDLEWIKAGKQNYEAIFESDRGTRSRLILMGSYEANSTNPMAFVFETSDEYQANAGYEFEINDKYRKLEGLFSVIRKTDDDTLRTFFHLGKRFSSDYPIITTDDFTIDSVDFRNCFIADSTNSHISSRWQNDTVLNIKRFVISKKYGLIYYQLATGEQFYRKFK